MADGRVMLITENELTSATVSEAGDLTFTRESGEVITAGNIGISFTRATNPRAYGAAGDDTTDDTTALQAAVTAAAAGGFSVDLRGLTYLTTDQLDLPSGTVLTNGTIHCTGTGKKILSITESNVKVSGVTVIGRHLVATAAVDEHAIAAVGTVGAPLSNIVIENVTIARVGMYGVYLANVEGYEVAGCTISDLGYAGIACMSATSGRIRGNEIRDILAGFSGNGYGITLTRAETDSLTTDPRSSNTTVTGNRITNVPWEGIDTHGGENLIISGNEVYACTVGIAVVGSDDSGNVTRWAPLNIEVSGNIIDSRVSDGSLGIGVSVAGAAGASAATSTEAATGRIVGNQIRGHGSEADSGSGAIRIRDTSNLVVSDNVIVNPAPNGIVIQNTNFGLVVVNNTIVDHWSNTVSTCAALHLPGGYNTGNVSNNLHRNNGGMASATYRNVRGWNCPTSLGMDIQATGNVLTATTTPINGVTTAKNRPEFQTQFAGSASAPGLAFGVDTASGFYPIAASDFAMSVAGARKLRFQSTAFFIEDGYNVSLGSTNGTRLGITALQKIGLWGATPVVQPAAITDAADATDAVTKLNALLAKLRTVGLIAS